MMGFWYSNTDESDDSISSKSPQSVPSISENVQSLDLSGADNLEECGTILNLSRAFWNLPADDSTKTENEENARINADETSSSKDCYMDEMAYDWALSLFRRISVRCRLGKGRPGSSRQTEPVISRKLPIGNLHIFLLLMLVTLIPASAILFGAQHIGHCPGNGLLPYFVLLIGLLSTIFMVYFTANLCGEYYNTLGGEDFKTIGQTFGLLLGILILIEITLFVYTPISFDTSSKIYCNESFYFYASFFNIFTIMAFIIGALGKWIFSFVLVNPSLDFHEDDLGV